MRFQRLWRPAIPLNDLTGGQWGDGSCRSAGTEAQVVEREGALEMTLSSLFILKMTRGAQRGERDCPVVTQLGVEGGRPVGCSVPQLFPIFTHSRPPLLVQVPSAHSAEIASRAP